MASFDLVRWEQRDTEMAFEAEDVARLRTKAADLNEKLERDYVNAQETWKAEREEDDFFVHNAQFTEDQEETLTARGQAAIPINVIYPAVEQAIAMLTTNKPSFQVTAREDSDRKTAKVYADLLSYIWHLSDGNTHLKTAAYDYYVRGRGVLHVYVDPNADFGRGELCVGEMDSFDVFPDPSSRDRLWRDAAHIIVSRIYTREQIEKMWPDAEEMGITQFASTSYDKRRSIGRMSATQAQSIGAVDAAPEDEEIKVIWRYSRVKQRHMHVFDSTVREERAFTDDEFEQYIQGPAIHIFQEGQPEQFFTEGPEYDQAVEMMQQGQPSSIVPGAVTVDLPPQVDPQTGMQVEQPPVVLTPLTIKDLIQDGLITVREVQLDRIQLVITIGGYEYYNSILPISHYPLIPINNRHSRNPYPMGDVAFVKPMQQVINKINMQILANIAMTNNNKLIVPRGSVDRDDVEEGLAMTGPAVIEVNYEMGEPKLMQPGQFPSGLFSYMAEVKNDVQRELGIFSTMMGDATQAPETFKGTLALDEFGQRRIRSKLDDIEGALTQCAKVLIDWIPKIYVEEKIIRLVQPNGAIRESIANHVQYDDLRVGIEKMNDVTVGTYDVVVVSGSTMPSNRWALTEYLTDLYKLQLVDQIEVLKKSDVVDMEGVLERQSYIKQLEGMLQQAEEEIKRLGNELTSARTNELTAKKQAVLEKHKAAVKGQEAKVAASATVAQQRMGDLLMAEKARRGGGGGEQAEAEE